MKRGFYTIMAAQFFSSLADNALLIAAIAQLLELDGPAWMIPLLKFFFTVSYVVLAAFVGAFADAIPKGRVMFITNTIKIAGCALLFFTGYVEFVGIPEYALVLTAYAVVGFGAAAYSPAKYGILTELLPPEKLVLANGWIDTRRGCEVFAPLRSSSHKTVSSVPNASFTGVNASACRPNVFMPKTV